MLRSAACKIGGALPHAPATAQCGRVSLQTEAGITLANGVRQCQIRTQRATYLWNRYIGSSAFPYDEAIYAEERPARPDIPPRTAWGASNAPARFTNTANNHDTIAAQDAAYDTIKTPNKPNRVDRSPPQQAKTQGRAALKLLTAVLERKTGFEKWELKAARSRSAALPIILAQIILRHMAAQGTLENSRLLDALPTEVQLRHRIAQLAEKGGYEEKDIVAFAHILFAKNDNERCARLLRHSGAVPVHIMMFILRPTSTLSDIGMIKQLIDLLKSTTKRADSNDLWIWADKSSKTYADALSLFSNHLMRTEPRLLVNIAESVCCYIKELEASSSTGETHIECCRLFNTALQIFQPKATLLDKQTALANAYFWESQRMLLTLSNTFPRPLQVSGLGFRAIRNTLAGMPKNETEKHSALLQAPSWPPYLTPGDGMDEITDSESHWSRTVKAGMLMQEAGFAKTDADESLDVMLGLAPDGSPTIQQRKLAGSHRKVGKWEALILATRNSREAWRRFNDPPQKGEVPKIEEYAAMFEKLCLPEEPITSKLLPGDKARNFPAHRAANLADIEWAKSQPPTVEELYEQMRHDGIAPSGHCLFMLVSKAPSMDAAHRYLKDAAELDPDISYLMVPTIDPSAVQGLSMGLISAYIRMLTRRLDGYGWENLQRAIVLAEARLGDKRSPWASLMWGAILKGASRHHSLLQMSRSDQVKLIIAMARRIDRGYGLNLSNFAEINRTLQKLIRYDSRALAEQLDAKEVLAGTPSKLPIRVLYDAAFANNAKDDMPDSQNQPPTPLPGTLKSLVDYIKQEFANFQARENSYQAAAQDAQISSLDRMLCRRDVVQSEHALEYMLAMGYAGEFQEMKQLLLFLIEEWRQPDIVQALEQLDDLPHWADFSEVLCVFRLLGEPMLGGPDVAEEIQDAIVEAGLPWAWPDAPTMETYIRTREGHSIVSMREVLIQMKEQTQAAKS